MTVSIIIPVFNEEKTIAAVLRRVYDASLPRGINREIIVVDDGSYDGTESILKRQKGRVFKCLRHSQNLGKGTAIRTGLKASSGELIIIQDADLEYDPKYYSLLLDPILTKHAEVVYGTRLVNYPLRLWGKNKTVMPTHLIANRALTALTNILYGSNLTDMETGYKVFTKDTLDGIKLESKGFDFEPEITAKMLRKGIKIVEVPIKVMPRTHKQGKKISWQDGFGAIFALLKYKFSND